MASSALIRHPAIFTAMSLLLACGGGEPAPPADTGAEPPRSLDGADVAGVYERSFVFASVDQDSVLLVPWLLETVAATDTVERVATGWLARGGVWDAFYEDRWSTPPTRAPARVLPHGSLSFVVRDGDAIDGVVFSEGLRSLELVLGDVAAAWVGPRGEAIEVLEGAAYLAEQRVEGAVLDMARATAQGSTPGGDWAFLISGDSARFVLVADSEHGGEAEPSYRGWADLGAASLQWPEIEVEWNRTQAFPPARRDVPVSWSLSSPDGLVTGTLSAVSSDIRAGSGPGPLLPVRALLQVTGTVQTVEGRFQVHGLLVHERR